MNAIRTRWTEKDRQFMQLALKLAEKGRGKTSPNPMVGAVVVKKGQVLAKGYHRRFGGPHAEAIAIKACGGKAEGATLYTTLEPCCHFGKTPPCTDLVIQSGISKVVCAAIDPNPRVNGKGLRQLTRKGIPVRLGLLGEESKRLNEAHFKYMTTGLPFVVLRVAQSLDGRVLRQDRSFRRTSRSGVSGLLPLKDQPIDAVLSDVDGRGFHTVATLFGSTNSRRPKLILLGAGRQIASAVKELPENTRKKTIVVTVGKSTIANRTPKGLTTWVVGKTKEGKVNPVSLLKKAGREGISSLLVDGGPELSTALLKRNLVDKIWYFISPEILAKGDEPFGDLGIRKVSQCKTVRDCEFKLCKDGILAVGYPSRVGGRKTTVSR
jgi:diaminohydroxyphosphoribosylaminopyrimidine deaminase/5-amino-6-(5-phosphoribosylamino)uracil reductase